jgi:RNA polymerase sigma-70 factor (ECF subfamily)
MKETESVKSVAAPAPEDADAECVAAVLRGDLAAFDRLVERYQRRALSVAYRLLGHAEDASDVAQEAFLRAYRSLDTLGEPAKFGAWLLRIVSNLALNARRGRRPMLSLVVEDRSDGRSSEETGRAVSAPASSEAGPAGSMLSEELDGAITEALEALPEKQRLALILFTVEGMPQKEVAEIMETSVEAVKWHVFQARQTLRVTLSEYLTE